MFTCVNCQEQKLIWDGDFSSEDFGYEEEGVVRMYCCAACGARYEVFVPEGNISAARSSIEVLLRQFVELFDAMPTYNDVEECIKEFAPRFIRWSDGRNQDAPSRECHPVVVGDDIRCSACGSGEIVKRWMETKGFGGDHSTVDFVSYDYCPHCGRKVVW